MLTKKDYCDYETSIALEELGFPLKRIKVKNFIDGEFSNSVPVLLYEAQKWLREEHNLHIDVRLHGIIGYQCEVCTSERTITAGREFLTYEEALSEGVRAAVKILKENGYGKDI